MSVLPHSHRIASYRCWASAVDVVLISWIKSGTSTGLGILSGQASPGTAGSARQILKRDTERGRERVEAEEGDGIYARIYREDGCPTEGR
jgi:hypothetical protein